MTLRGNGATLAFSACGSVFAMGTASPMMSLCPGMAVTRLFRLTKKLCDAVIFNVRWCTVFTQSIVPFAGCRDTWVIFVHDTFSVDVTPTHCS